MHKSWHPVPINLVLQTVTQLFHKVGKGYGNVASRNTLK